MRRTKSTYLALAAVLLLLIGPLTANADSVSASMYLIDNGTYTTDTSTGLDWLDLSATANATYASAETNNPGWRYATNAEVEGIFAMFFEPTFVGDANGWQGSSSVESLANTSLFMSLIGPTIDDDPIFYSLGYYMDEDDLLRAMGADMETGVVTGITGPEWSINYGGSARQAYGTYLVRATDTDGDGDPDATDPDDDNDGIGDAFDDEPLTPNNSCSGLDPQNVTFQQLVTGNLSCAAEVSISVVPPGQVQALGNLRLIAPAVTFVSGFTVAGQLEVISSHPCPACSP